MAVELLHIDCMTYMKTLPDNAFDLAIVDPPYGIDAASDVRGDTQYGNAAAKSKSYGKKDWDKAAPLPEYFKELMRVSKNQIVWGANHFIENMPHNSSCWIVWDKENGENGYADCELAWASFGSAVRRFRYKWQGMLQGNMKSKENRIHPTQKPKALYKWLLQKYAKAGDRILDTHLGSGSSAIVADKMGFDFVGCEIDKEYYDNAVARFNKETDLGMFETPKKIMQAEIF